MAVPFLLLLLVASGGAAGGDEGAGLWQPHLQLHGIDDSGSGHASDAAPQGHSLTRNLLLTHGCEHFAALVAATANATEIFCDHVVAGDGLTVFCPNDPAMAAFETKLSNLSTDDQLAVVLYHGAAARYGRKEIAAFESVEIRTLAATNETHVLTVRDDGETVWLWPSSRGSCGYAGAARVTDEIASGKSTLAVYVVDVVLLPSELRRRLDGWDEAAACTSCGGYLGWLHHTVPVWGAICMSGAGILGVLTGVFLAAVRMN